MNIIVFAKNGKLVCYFFLAIITIKKTAVGYHLLPVRMASVEMIRTSYCW